MNTNVGNGTHWLPWYEQKYNWSQWLPLTVWLPKSRFWVNYSFKGRRKKKKKKKKKKYS